MDRRRFAATLPVVELQELYREKFAGSEAGPRFSPPTPATSGPATSIICRKHRSTRCRAREFSPMTRSSMTCTRSAARSPGTIRT